MTITPDQLRDKVLYSPRQTKFKELIDKIDKEINGWDGNGLPKFTLKVDYVDSVLLGMLKNHFKEYAWEVTQGFKCLNIKESNRP